MKNSESRVLSSVELDHVKRSFEALDLVAEDRARITEMFRRSYMYRYRGFLRLLYRDLTGTIPDEYKRTVAAQLRDLLSEFDVFWLDRFYDIVVGLQPFEYRYEISRQRREFADRVSSYRRYR